MNHSDNTRIGGGGGGVLEIDRIEYRTSRPFSTYIGKHRRVVGYS